MTESQCRSRSLRHSLSLVRLHVLRKHVPMAEVASSRINNLLCRTMARASAMICLWPTDRFPPPLAIWLSNASLFSSESFCKENSPAERSASFRTVSSYCPKRCRLWRSVPLSSSGTWGMIVMFERRESRLSEAVSMPSYVTLPSVTMQRRRARVKVDLPEPVRPTMIHFFE